MLNDMTIKSRLIMMMGFLSLLLIGVGGFGLYGINQSNNGLKTVYEDRTVPATDLATINDHWQIMRMNAVVAANLNDTEIARARTADNNRRTAEVQKIWSAFQGNRA